MAGERLAGSKDMPRSWGKLPDTILHITAPVARLDTSRAQSHGHSQ